MTMKSTIVSLPIAFIASGCTHNSVNLTSAIPQLNISAFGLDFDFRSHVRDWIPPYVLRRHSRPKSGSKHDQGDGRFHLVLLKRGYFYIRQPHDRLIA